MVKTFTILELKFSSSRYISIYLYMVSKKNVQKFPMLITFLRWYSGEDKTLVVSLGGDFSINNAFNPKNLGAKGKLLISRFQNPSWMLDLELN